MRSLIAKVGGVGIRTVILKLDIRQALACVLSPHALKKTGGMPGYRDLLGPN